MNYRLLKKKKKQKLKIDNSKAQNGYIPVTLTLSHPYTNICGVVKTCGHKGKKHYCTTDM